MLHSCPHAALLIALLFNSLACDPNHGHQTSNDKSTWWNGYVKLNVCCALLGYYFTTGNKVLAKTGDHSQANSCYFFWENEGKYVVKAMFMKIQILVHFLH